MEELQTLVDLLPRLARHKERPAVVAFQKEQVDEWTYERLAQQALRLATGLTESGLAKGDHIAICAENGPEWIAACLGILAAGSVVVSLDVQLADDLLHHTLDDSGARYVFTTERQARRLKPIARRARCEPILLGEGADRVRGWEDLCAEATEPTVDVSPDDRAVLFYTSGTTGRPKGVPLTHRNLNSLARTWDK